MKARTIEDLPFSPEARQRVRDALYRDGSPGKRKGKYGNEVTEYNGVRYASKLEARCAQELDLRKAAKEVLWWTRQVPFRLPGGEIYRADFLAVLAAGGVEVIEPTGHMTATKRRKLRKMLEYYGISVRLWPQR